MEYVYDYLPINKNACLILRITFIELSSVDQIMLAFQRENILNSTLEYIGFVLRTIKQLC